jgi:hypothetical protein
MGCSSSRSTRSAACTRSSTGRCIRPNTTNAVLKPGGRLQIGDILVQKAVPDSAKRKIELWTG